MDLQDYRCKYCNKLFFKGNLKNGLIEIKCRNCKQFNMFEFHEQTFRNLSDQKGSYDYGSGMSKGDDASELESGGDNKT